MDDIIINGVSLHELGKQRAAIEQGACAFISDNLVKVKALINEVVESGGEDDALARKALLLLESIELVASVSGVEYFLPYNNPYDSGNTLSDELECSIESGFSDTVEQLYDLLQTMERNSFLWNSSSVDC